MMSKIKSWLWWIFLDNTTKNYIRYKCPEYSLLMRYLTREETLYIPWDELEAIELPKHITRNMLMECRAWYQESMDNAEVEYYKIRIGDSFMYRLYLLRLKQKEELDRAYADSWRKLDKAFNETRKAIKHG